MDKLSLKKVGLIFVFVAFIVGALLFIDKYINKRIISSFNTDLGALELVDGPVVTTELHGVPSIRQQFLQLRLPNKEVREIYSVPKDDVAHYGRIVNVEVSPSNNRVSFIVKFWEGSEAHTIDLETGKELNVSSGWDREEYCPYGQRYTQNKEDKLYVNLTLGFQMIIPKDWWVPLENDADPHFYLCKNNYYLGPRANPYLEAFEIQGRSGSEDQTEMKGSEIKNFIPEAISNRLEGDSDGEGWGTWTKIYFPVEKKLFVVGGEIEHLTFFKTFKLIPKK